MTFTSNAATPDFKTEFSTLFNGRTAKIVWISPQNQIWGMDTKDGTARKITSDADLAPNSARLHDPSMTWDQTRIVFTNMQNMSVYVVNWDGSGFKKIATGFFSAYCWRGQNKDYVLVAPKSRSTDNNARVLRMNIDNVADTLLLWNKTLIGSGESFHASLSVDGTRMAENYPHPQMGAAIVPNGAVNYYKGPEICVPTISRDNQYKILCFNHDHTNFVITDTSGNDLLNKPFSGTNALPFTAVNSPSYLRWSTDQDIATVDNYVVRISDLKYVNLTVSGSKAMGIDVAITGLAAINPTIAPVFDKNPRAEDFRLFNALGRGIDNPFANGVLLSQDRLIRLQVRQSDRTHTPISRR